MLPAVDRIVKNIKPKYDDDCIDRLNYAYTSGFFVILILVIGAKQYVGEPLQCWMNAEFKGSWEKYIENYCKLTEVLEFGLLESPKAMFALQHKIKHPQLTIPVSGFVENTYYVSFEKDYLPAEENRKPYELRYYQWVSWNMSLQVIIPPSFRCPSF